MGLLDDAIREHLDLKRRRGADPAEVERLEREALGPVRREFEQPLPASQDAGESSWEEGPPEAGWEQTAAGEESWPDEERSWEAPGPARPVPPSFMDEEDEEPDPSIRPRAISFQPRSLRDRFRRGSRDDEPEPPVEPYEEASRFEPHEPLEGDPYAAPGGHDPRQYAGQETVEYDALADEPPFIPPGAPGEEETRVHFERPEPGSEPGAGPEFEPGAAPGLGEDPGLGFEEGVRRIPREPPPPPHPAGPPIDHPSEPHGAAPQPPPARPAGRPPASPPPERPGPPGPDEDVLEETPEFLHDTPEHDRLWFEQRPPRDFDFDG